MTDSGSARRDESNDMCFEAGRRFVPEIASAHAHCDETHIIRFVSTSRTRIRQLRIDWLRVENNRDAHPSTAHTPILVEICSNRMISQFPRFSTAHAQ